MNNYKYINIVTVAPVSFKIIKKSISINAKKASKIFHYK